MRSPDVEKTIQDFDRAEALGSTVPELYYGRAQLWEKKGNIEKALDDWQNVLRLTSDPAMVKEAEKRKAKLSKKLIAR
jgi:tetratricopeptide (TPR) repeat protein